MRRSVFTREDVVAAGLEVVARHGLAQLSARRVADELGASTAPVYSNFANMDELADEVKRAALADLLAATRGAHAADPFLNLGVGILTWVWARPRLYAALFLEQSSGYDAGPDLMDALLARMERLPDLEDLPATERVIVLKKMAYFTQGLAIEICRGRGVDCTLECLTALMAEVGEAVVRQARAGVERQPQATRDLAALWRDAPDAARADDPNREETES